MMIGAEIKLRRLDGVEAHWLLSTQATTMARGAMAARPVGLAVVAMAGRREVRRWPVEAAAGRGAPDGWGYGGARWRRWVRRVQPSGGGGGDRRAGQEPRPRGRRRRRDDSDRRAAPRHAAAAARD